MKIRYDELAKYMYRPAGNDTAYGNRFYIDDNYDGYSYIVVDTYYIMCVQDKDWAENKIVFNPEVLYTKEWGSIVKECHNMERRITELAEQSKEITFKEYRKHPTKDNITLMILETDDGEEIWINRAFLKQFYAGIIKKDGVDKDISFTGVDKDKPIIVWYKDDFLCEVLPITHI